MTKPPICVVFLTYRRLKYASTTIRSFAANARYSGEISAHIADDGSPTGYLDSLLCVAEQTGAFTQITSSDSERGGYGRNYNLATQYAHDYPYIMCIEDDWELSRPLDLDKLVDVLEEHPQYGCIRLGYIGWTQDLLGKFVGINGDTYLHLLPDSPEPHVFAGHPRLESREYQRRVGEWPEGLNPGETEFAVAHIPAAREGVLWPVDLVRPAGDMFVHIGSERSY